MIFLVFVLSEHRLTVHSKSGIAAAMIFGSMNPLQLALPTRPSPCPIDARRGLVPLDLQTRLFPTTNTQDETADIVFLQVWEPHTALQSPASELQALELFDQISS